MNSRTISELVGKHPFLESEATLEEFVEAWKRGTLPKKAWTHGAHVAMAAYFTFDHSQEEALPIVRAGIIHFNACVGTANTEDSGYHETLTRFWLGLVREFVESGSFASRWEAARGAVQEFGEDRERFRRYYSFDVVRDRVARREWVAPDRAPEASSADQSDVELSGNSV
jgi:hypothetical protein